MTSSRFPVRALCGLLLALSLPSAHAAQSRTAFVVDELNAFNGTLPPGLLAEKYTRMKASAFAFFRGSNHLYWKDLGASPLLATYGGTRATRTWLSGDMHLNNTGAFDDDTGDIVFGLNDFDEAVIGDYQLDVWRLATSLLLAAREAGTFSTADQEVLVDAFSKAYLDTMKGYAGNNGETTRKFRASNTYGLLNDFLDDVSAKNTRAKLLDTWTARVQGVRQFSFTSPEAAPVSVTVRNDLVSRMSAYRATLGGGTTWPSGYFTVKDVMQRLGAGIGSTGATRYYVLIEGATSSPDDDRILEWKAQRAPSAWPHVGAEQVGQTNATSGGDLAARVVVAAKALGYRVDDHLGWTTLADGQPYSVRELSPWKASFPVEDLTTLTRFTHLAEQWGQVLATHHARADKDWNASVFPHSLDGEIQSRTDKDAAGFRARVRAVATDYAQQVKFDYDSFRSRF
ncbi:DUF2252 domain-containing protein [Archangium primigenium]|uniref:DUF2252 domain-containing protein n=1 Tax=[Archangium] primigenium TaxID=2792470 RepID=UPI001959D9DC|nr:DUF2252 family protein [Archangium primigenium]MBM7117936.1 DUF2252 family protein [Archangium primigenium]